MKLLGQPHISKFLLQGLHKRTLNPSLLFVGPTGVGKETAAMELAKYLLCLHRKNNEALPESNAECPVCLKVDQNNHVDMLFLDRALQAKILGEEERKQTAVKIDAVRFIDNFLHLKSLTGGARLAIINEAHLLTDEAANALLKLLEEPPPNSTIILIATDEHQLPVTVVSRCTVLRFRPVPESELIRWLHTSHGMDVDTAEVIAHRANGSFEKALAMVKEDIPSLDWNIFTRPEFFEEVRSPQFRKDPRENARQALDQLIEKSQKKLRGGDFLQKELIQLYLKAKRQIRHNVSPQLVLEEVFLKLESFKKEST